MARQIYFRGQATPANVSLPPTANVASVPHANSDVADIAKGIAGLAGAATKAYLAHEGRIQEGLVDEAYLKARSRMTQWQADYNKTHKAGDALNAQRDYEAQWQQIAGDIAKEYQGRLSGAYAKKFDRGMELGRLYALSHGGVYQEAQTKVWDKNQTELLLQNALSAIDTGDPAQAQLERQRLVEQVQRVHPGENIAPYMQKIDLALFERQFNGKLAQGDFRGAEAMLNGYAPQAQGGGTSSAIQGAPAGSVITTRGKRGSIADDQNNPWNLSKRGTNDDTPRRQRFEVYSSPEEGTLAAFRQFQRYNEGKLGSKVQVGTRDGQPVYAAMNTLRGMVHKWQSGRTDAPAKVVAWMQRQGLDVDSPVDMNTPQGQEAVAQMMSYLAINESSWSISPQQVLQVVRGQGRSGGQAQAPMFSAYDKPQGLVEQGNIDIANRPRVKNADGSVSTVRSISVNVGGKETLIPTVSEDGRIMSDDEAVEQFRKTGKHLGKFDSVKNAEEYAQRLHEQQERMYVGGSVPAGMDPAKYSALSSRLDSTRRRLATQWGLTQDAFNNHIAYGIENGDFSFAENDKEKLQQLGMGKELSTLTSQIEMGKVAYTILNGVGDMPLSAQKGEASKRFKALETPENAKIIQTMRNHIESVVQQRQTQFIKDPAGYVATLPSMQVDMLPRDKIRVSLEEQARIGEGLPYERRVLPKAAAESMRKQYDSFENGDQRAAFLIQVHSQYGEYTADVFHEMKLQRAVGLLLPGLERGGLDPKELGILVTGMSAKKSENPELDVTDDWTAMKDAVGEGFELYNTVKTASKAMYNNDLLMEMSNSLLKAGYYYLKKTGKDSFDDINDAFSTYADEKTFFVFPKNMNVKAKRFFGADVYSAIEWGRDNGFLEDELVRQGVLSPASNDVNERYQVSQSRNIIRKSIIENMIACSSYDGKNIYFVDPRTQQPLRNKKGNLALLPVSNLMERYEEVPFFGEVNENDEDD